MVIVTGGAGFIGSNLVAALNKHGINDIVVVDNLSHGGKIHNIADCEIADYLDKEDFLRRIVDKVSLGAIDAILHLGACSTTTEWDGRYVMRNNYEYSKALLGYATDSHIPFL